MFSQLEVADVLLHSNLRNFGEKTKNVHENCQRKQNQYMYF